jgi:hypothetical protein
MPLSDDEAGEAFRHLIVMMRDSGFAWVVTQVEEKVALGKVRTAKFRAKELPEYPEAGLLEDRQSIKPTSKAATFTVSDTYSAQERLEILIESLKIAVPVARDVAEQAISRLSEFGDVETLSFQAETGISEAFALSIENVREKRESNEHLTRLLDELRGETLSADQTTTTR